MATTTVTQTAADGSKNLVLNVPRMDIKARLEKDG